MKIPDFRKYFFSYTTIVMAIVFYGLLVVYHNAHFPPGDPEDFIHPGTGLFIIIGYWFLFYLYSCGFLILEILIRKFIINRFFPNLKFPIQLNIPKVITRIYTVIFGVLFVLALLPAVVAIILFVLL